VFYAPIAAACDGSVRGPFYRVSTNPDDITRWDAQTAYTVNGSFSEITGGFDANGVLHLFGQHQCSGSINSFDLTYARRLTDGTWQVVGLVRDNQSGPAPSGKPNGAQGDPGCYPAARVIGTTVYVLFTRSTASYGACNGENQDIFLIKSTDGGNTWTSAGDSGAFSRTTGLSATYNSSTGLYDYPAIYRVFQGASSGGSYDVNQLADGTPVVTYQDVRRSAQSFTKFTGGAWSIPVDVETVSGIGARGAWTIVVTSAGKLLIHGSETGYTMNEYVSMNGGSSWMKMLLRQPGSETSNRWAKANVFMNLAGKERVVVQWVQTTGTGAATNVGLMDRPQ